MKPPDQALQPTQPLALRLRPNPHFCPQVAEWLILRSLGLVQELR
jgi:hypothetical protein